MFKSLVTVSAVLAMAAPAFASKARMASLQNAAHVIDTQSIFENPAKSFLLGDFATLEMGATTVTATGVSTPENVITNGTTAATLYAPGAEGGFVRSYGDSKLGFYMGRKSAFTSRVRGLTGFAGQENPIEVVYGFQAMDLKWGASFNYSKSDKKTADQQKQDAMGIRLGAAGTNWDAALTLGLGSKATGNAALGILSASATSEYKGTTGARIAGGYWMDQTYIFANYYMDGVEMSGVAGRNAGAAGDFSGLTGGKIEQNQYEIGVIDTIKSDGVSFFYGASYIGFKSKTDSLTGAGAGLTTIKAAFDQEQTQLPFVVGVEADATSWLTLRAGAKQNVLLSGTKVNGGETTTIANNTTVAVGAGLKFNKFTVDSTLAAGNVPGTAGTAAINSANLMANASLTYLF